MKSRNELPEELLKILACPVCKNDLEFRKNIPELFCKRCGEHYPIEDGIPIMIPEAER